MVAALCTLVQSANAMGNTALADSAIPVVLSAGVHAD